MVRVGVSVIIRNHKNEFLVGKRKGSHGEGLLSTPGGHLEFNESYNLCCDRELMEEIGVNFGKYEKVGFSEDFFKVGDDTKHYITLYFAVDVNSDKIKIVNMEPDKCEEWVWVKFEDMSENMFCDTYSQIKKYYYI